MSETKKTKKRRILVREEREELYKLPLGDEIDFTIKSDLTNATFIVEGRKIYAGKDFLSLLSPFFNIILNSDKFAEKDMEEHEIKDLKYDDFMIMLAYLTNPIRPIEVNDVESLLILGDRFDITGLVHRVESFLHYTEEITDVNKFILADRFRLNRLEIFLYLQMLNYYDLKDHLSESALTAHCQNTDDFSGDPKRGHIKILEEADSVEEQSNSIIATGPLTYLMITRRITVILWRTSKREWPLHFSMPTKTRILSCTGVRKDFFEVDLVRHDLKTGKETERYYKKFSFSLDNDHPCCRYKMTMEDYKLFKGPAARITINITEISGLRNSPNFDFTSPSDLSDGSLIVDGNTIHINKQYLSIISTSFREMFHDKSEVHLTNVDYEDVIEFLYWIYPSNRKTQAASSMFSVLKVARELKVEIDESIIKEYISYFGSFYLTGGGFIEKIERHVLLEENMIFYFQFNIGDEDSLKSCDWVDQESEPKFKGVYNRIKRYPLYARMTTDKKAKMLEWLMEQEYEEKYEEEDDDESE